MYLNDNIFDFGMQLEDGKNDWDSKKVRSIALSDSFKRLNKIRKSASVRECGTYLEFKRFDSGDFKLHTANFCRVRLCPLCSWRRSLKIFAQTSRIMDKLDNKSYKFIFLTLTCKNVSAMDLADTLDVLFKAYNNFNRRKVIKDSFVGWFRALEVTYNKKSNTYHPHFHVVLCAKSSYFKKHYVSQDTFATIWQECLGVDYKPIVDVRKFSKKKGVSEACKYAVKDSDYLTKKGVAIDSVVNTLDDCLAGRRLVALGGIFKDIAKELKLDDMEDGNLINIDGEDELRDDLGYVIEKYCWHVGFNSYYGLKNN